MENDGDEHLREFDFNFERTPGSGGDAANDVVEPASIPEQPVTIAEPVKRRRGRPAGSRNSGKEKALPLDLSGLETILASVHFMLATLTKNPELKLSQDEAKVLTDATAKVARHYPNIAATQLVLDWSGLAVTCVGIYGAKAAAIKLRKKVQAQQARPMFDDPNVVKMSNMVGLPQ